MSADRTECLTQTMSTAVEKQSKIQICSVVPVQSRPDSDTPQAHDGKQISQCSRYRIAEKFGSPKPYDCPFLKATMKTVKKRGTQQKSMVYKP
jgi:hypothetical protein